MSLHRVRELQAAAERVPSIAAYDALLTEDMAYLMAHAQRIREAEKRRHTAQQRRKSLQSAITTLQDRRSKTNSSPGLLETQGGEAVRRSDAAQDVALAVATGARTPVAAAYPQDATSDGAAVSLGSSVHHTNSIHPGVLAADSATRTRHERAWLRWMTEFATRKEVLTHLLACPAEDLAVVDLTHVAHWLDTWSVFFNEANTALRALRHHEKQYNNSVVSSASRAFAAASAAAAAASSPNTPYSHLATTTSFTSKNDTNDNNRDGVSTVEAPVSDVICSAAHPPASPATSSHRVLSSCYVPLPPTQILFDAMDEVCRLQLKTRSLVGRERYRRSANTPDAVQDFLQNQSQLMDWCAQQRRTLSAMHSLPELTEFSTSLQTNVGVMETNFTILMEQAEALRQNESVLHALREANKAWMDLLIDTYMQLRAAAVEEQVESKLEQRCGRWGAEVATRVSDYLVSTHSYLKFLQRHLTMSARHVAPLARSDAVHSTKEENCTDCTQEHGDDGNVVAKDTPDARRGETHAMAESRLSDAGRVAYNAAAAAADDDDEAGGAATVVVDGDDEVDYNSGSNSSSVCLSRVEALLVRNTALLNDAEAFQTLCAHVSDFTERRECVEPHLQTLQQALRSQLAATVLSFPAEVDYKDRQGYRNRMDEMREWIDVRSQKSTYMKLLERLDETKKIVEDYADALFPESVDTSTTASVTRRSAHAEDCFYTCRETDTRAQTK